MHRVWSRGRTLVRCRTLNQVLLLKTTCRIRRCVKFDGPHNRLVIIPNHEGSGSDPMDVDWNDVDDDIDIEEMD